MLKFEKGINVGQLLLGAAVGASGAVLTYQTYKYFKDATSNTQGKQPTTQGTTQGPISINREGSTFSPVTRPTNSTHTVDEAGDGIVETSIIYENEHGILEDETQPVLNLLYSIAEDQAKKDGYMHRGITCNICNQSPLCGIRYKCSSCIDYDICERCEPKDVHNSTHVFLRIKVPLPPLANPRTSLVKIQLYPGRKHTSRISPDEILKYKQETYFDHYEIEAIYEQYKLMATNEMGITREVFDQCLGPLAHQKNLVVDRLFKYYDRNNDKYIDFPEMITGLSLLVKGSQNEKLPYAFEGYDIENKGYISKDNLRRMFKAYFNITIELVRDVVKACEEEMMSNFDDASGKPVSALFSAPLPPDSTNNNITKGSIPANPGSRESMWPVMESMSQDAIDEMVSNIFNVAKLQDGERMTLDKFREVALVDSSLVAWFDALGTVF